LTDQCVLRDAVLAKTQLVSGFDVVKKLSYLSTKLEQAKQHKRWNDLELGCYNLFGVDNLNYLLEYPEVLEKKFNYIIPQLIDQKKYLFIVAHTMQILEALQKFWTNARVIFFVEYDQFIQQRGYKNSTVDLKKIHQYWATVKGIDWPEQPPLSQSDFLKLPTSVQQELTENFNGEIFRWFDYSDLANELTQRDVYKCHNLLKNKSFIWNVAETFNGDVDKCLLDLHRCADWLGLIIAADNDNIVDYYNIWLETIALAKSPY
jgi:hypothetical protein